MLGVGTLGLGLLNEASVSYRFDAPVSLYVRSDPLALGFGSDGTAVSAGVSALASYDSRFFEIGLGVGWSRIASTVSSSGFALSQMVRLGARDGLNLTASNGFVLDNDKFNYAGTTGSIHIPLVATLGLLLQGGGGPSYAFGEIGLRVRLTGNGNHGTVFLVPTVGGGAVFGRTCTYTYDYQCSGLDLAGPLVGIGVDWRP
jgi:hypothetical protein